MNTPTTKRENYELYHKGYYGNHLRFWPSLSDLYRDVMEGTWKAHEPVALRTVDKPGIQLPRYCSVTYLSEVGKLAHLWINEYGINPNDIVVNEIGKDGHIILQGEVTRSTKHYSLYYSTAKFMMREALVIDPQHLDGLQAIKMLESKMDAPSYENLQRLFDEFPEAVIEFSIYDQPVGNLQHNTVFWEVRAY